MNILTSWLRHYLPTLPVTDRQLADDLTLRGIAVEGVHDLGPNNGHLFEMDITTNRVDAMNHYGIAREAATIYNLLLSPLIADKGGNKEKVVILSEAKNPRILSGAAPSFETQAFPVTIEAKHLCGRFTAQVLRNVTIAPSTGQIAEYFTFLNQKQISNAVDASNFVLLGMGHPTHAFDLDKLEGGIIVRLAHKGEKLKLLDGTDRTLEPDDLVVADHKKALALAGVMGGWDSMITPETKNVLVEAAWFDQSTVRRSSRRHGLHTDASHRFERGADFNAAPIANALVSQLILQQGGQAEGALIDVIVPEIAARTASRPPINLSVKQVQRHLGTTIAPEGITSDIVHQYLTALGCILTETKSISEKANFNPASTTEGAGGFSPLNNDPPKWGFSPGSSSTPDTTFEVQLPSWRLDLEREIDLIEEVARVYGYNRFANTLPTAMPVIAHPTAAKEAAVRTRLLALGYSESISSTFASHADTGLFAEEGKQTVPMENPLSEEASLLRPSLLPGMLNMLAHNLNRDVKDVRLFEQGQIFTGTVPADGTFISDVHESPQLSLGLTGDAPLTQRYTAQSPHFFELKGAIESVLSLFDLRGPSFRPEAAHFAAGVEKPAVSSAVANPITFTAEAPAWLQPGRSATALINNDPIAHFGELAHEQKETRKLRQPVYVAQLDLAKLYELPLKKVTAHDLSRYQAVERDFSFVFPDPVQWHTIASGIQCPQHQRTSGTSSPSKSGAMQNSPASIHSSCAPSSSPTTALSATKNSRNGLTSIIETLTSLGGTLRA